MKKHCTIGGKSQSLLETATARDVPFVMMVDAHGRPGSAQCRAVGSESSTGRGAGLHSCMSAMQMCAQQRSSKIRPPERGERSTWHGI